MSEATSDRTTVQADAPQPDQSYLLERLSPLGWTPEGNSITLPSTATGDGKEYQYPLFEADADGNLVINYYTPTGAKAEYRRAGAKWPKHYQVVRWRTPRVRLDGSIEKYKHPSGTGTRPWFAPNIIAGYNTGQECETIVLVEGVLKAYALAMHGVHAIGLSGIHNLKDRESGTLHQHTLDVLKALKPRQVIFLHDADCRRLSDRWPEHPETDLYRRPNSFFTSARNMGELLKDYARMVGFRAWYMHVLGDSFTLPPKTEAPKGVDDLLLTYADAKVFAAGHRVTKDAEPVPPSEEQAAMLRSEAYQEVVEDLLSVGRPPRHFERRDLDRPDKLRDYFHLRSADSFYIAHQEAIGEKEFVYDGTKYQWDEGEKGLKVKVPSVARRYVRVGVDYYKYIRKPNPYSEQLEEHLVKWSRKTIVEDHGQHFPEHILKLEAFTNYPDHVAYQEIKNNCLNSYARFMHQPSMDGEEPVYTLKFLRHIFGGGTVRTAHPKRPGEVIEVNELDLGLDYIKLLYERPTQLLPILCLVSRKRGTGKTTFFDWLQVLFGANATQIGARDLEGDFNAHYASKLLAIIDEALVGKRESVEKLKHMSTAKQIMVNTKGVTQYPQPFFCKFLLGSNNVRDFIRTDEDEVRFWVRDIPPIPKADLDITIMEKMVAEIPDFLEYLGKRKMATEPLFRSWFHPPLLMTEALKEVQRHSVATARHSIEEYIAAVFMAKPELKEITMTVKDLRKEVFPGTKVEEKYIREMLKYDMGLKPGVNLKGEEKPMRYSYWRFTEAHTGNGHVEKTLQEVKSTYPQRYWVFPRNRFVDTQAETAEPEVVGEEVEELPF